MPKKFYVLLHPLSLCLPTCTEKYFVYCEISHRRVCLLPEFPYLVIHCTEALSSSFIASERIERNGQKKDEAAIGQRPVPTTGVLLALCVDISMHSLRVQCQHRRAVASKGVGHL